MSTTLHACEQRELPRWVRGANLTPDEDKATLCREVGVRFIRDNAGYGHWTCPAHEGIVRAYFNRTEGENR